MACLLTEHTGTPGNTPQQTLPEQTLTGTTAGLGGSGGCNVSVTVSHSLSRATALVTFST